MASKQEWETYIQEYENNMPEPTPDNISDYAKQWAYLQWLKAIYGQYENDWDNMPDTISMTAKTASGTYQSRLDHQWHAVIITPFSGSSTVMAQSDEFNVTVAMELYDSRGRMPEFDSGYYDDGYYIGVRSFVTLDGSYVKQSLNGAPYFTDSTYNNGSTGWQFYTCQIRIPKTGSPGEQSQNTFGSAYNFIAVGSQATIGTGGLLTTLTGDIDTDSPWDYYNDEILPNIDPDNAAFPEGYEPPPDTSDPDDDIPIDTPVVTGDDMNIQDDRTLGTPSDFVTMYMITPPILSQFGRTLWTSLANYNPQDPTSVDVFKNFYAVLNEQVTGSLDIGSIMSFIVSVRQYPFAVSDITNIYELVGNSISFGTGKLPINCGSAAQVYRLTSTIGVLDLGTVTIADYNGFKLYNDFRDYYNTSVSAYLPYCGTVELNPIEAIHSTIHCYYAIDFYTGECTAFLTTTTEDGHTIISGTKSGTIGVLIPITATNSGQIAARHLSDNAKDSMLITSAAGNIFSAIGNLATGNVMGAVGNVTGLAQIGAQQNMLDAERQGRSAVMAPSLSGGVGAAAFVSPATASILVRRGTYARHKIPNYPQTCGYPETSSGQLKTYKGYTECYNVNVDSINCTEEEKAAIKLALESGVYLSDV